MAVVVLGAVLWVAAAAISSASGVGVDLVDRLLVLAPLVVVPLGLPLAGVEDRRVEVAHVVSGVALFGAFVLKDTTTAGAVAASSVWAVASLLTTRTAVVRVLGAMRGRRDVGIAWPEVARGVALAYLVVAAAFAVQAVAGFDPLDLSVEIVELTGVHYAFAGFGASLLAGRAVEATGPSRAGITAVVLVGGAPPVVAAGFVTRWWGFQVTGALLLLVGTYLTAWLTFRASAAIPGVARLLLRVSSVAIVVPMLLAVSWAANQFWTVPALSIPDMARTHGMLNAFGFVGCGLLGWRCAVTPGASPPTSGR